MIVVDQRGNKDDTNMRLRHERLLTEKKRDHAVYANLVESLFFAPSHLGVGVQLADLVAGAIFRLSEHDDPGFFDQLKPAFRKNANGSIDGHGLVHSPKLKIKTPGRA